MAAEFNHQIDRDTVLCGSFAARPSNVGTRFHNYLYAALDLNFVYKAFSPVDIAQAVGAVRGLPMRGAAVSMPYKAEVIPLLDEVEPSAAAIGAVNTIVNDGRQLRGLNTDVIAVQSLLSAHGVGPGDAVVVIGSGGMARACAAAARAVGVARLVIASRNIESGSAVASAFAADFSASPVVADVVINATPIGMAGGDAEKALPCSREVLLGSRLVVDVVAMPEITPLIGIAVSMGKESVRGSQIMTLQAVEQFVLYTGVRPDAELVRAAAEFARA